MNNQPLVSIQIGSKDRFEKLSNCIESVLSQTYHNFEILIIDDNSKEKYADKLINRFKDPRIKCIRSEKSSSGVAGGRNKLTKISNGVILVILDDDAKFRHKKALQYIVDHFEKNPDIGLLAFKIIDIIDNKEKGLRVPFSRTTMKNNPRVVDTPQYVSYYLGGGHAVRKVMFDICGLYQDNLFFGGEELDLAYRIIDHNYKLFYFPEVIVEHYPIYSESLEKTFKNGSLYYTIRNRIWINYKYLPWLAFITNNIFWILALLYSSFKYGGTMDVIKGTKDGFANLKDLTRKPVKSDTIKYLKTYHGRIYR